MKEKDIKKTKKKVLIALLCVVLIFAIIFRILVGCFSYTPRSLFARAYQGDRVEINVYATVDGEPVEITKAKNELNDEDEYLYGDYTLLSRLQQKDGYTKISCKAKSYGDYYIYLNIDDKYPIAVTFYQFNWWNIQRSDLYIDYNTKTNEITSYENYTYLSEDGQTVSEKKEKTTFNLDDQNLIYVGQE